MKATSRSLETSSRSSRAIALGSPCLYTSTRSTAGGWTAFTSSIVAWDIAHDGTAPCALLWRDQGLSRASDLRSASGIGTERLHEARLFEQRSISQPPDEPVIGRDPHSASGPVRRSAGDHGFRRPAALGELQSRVAPRIQ